MADEKSSRTKKSPRSVIPARDEIRKLYERVSPKLRQPKSKRPPPRPRLSITKILKWADHHHELTENWPNQSAGRVRAADAIDEKWVNLDAVLRYGLRGLPGGMTLAGLLYERRGVRSRGHAPRLTEARILAWSDEHHGRTGRWPKAHDGSIPEANGETWSNINSALVEGSRGLRGGTSLARLLQRHRHVRNKSDLPRLSYGKILKWADAHRSRTGRWPIQASGLIHDAPGETWLAVDHAIRVGQRGLPGGTSLPKLLDQRRGVPNRGDRGRLTIKQILAWADEHKQRTGKWPNIRTGTVHGAPMERWDTIDGTLWKGVRGLPGGDSLAKVLARYRGMRNIADLPDLTMSQVLEWVDDHHRRTGRWPSAYSGKIPGTNGENWHHVNKCLRYGLRSLPAGRTLAMLLRDVRGHRYWPELPDLTERTILQWADAWFAANGSWPRVLDGKIPGTEEETWAGVNACLERGRRGLPGGDSLARLLARRRGPIRRPRGKKLSEAQILVWADAFHKRTGQWPHVKSGTIAEAPKERWIKIDKALRAGRRGLPGGSSLARLLHERRGKWVHTMQPKLTVKQILKWVDEHRRRTGRWPSSYSGVVHGTDGEKWLNIHQGLVMGLRGLPKGSSLAKLLDKHRR